MQPEQYDEKPPLLHARQPGAMDGFARLNAGVTSPAEFFSEDNVGRILAAGGRPPA